MIRNHVWLGLKIYRNVACRVLFFAALVCLACGLPLNCIHPSSILRRQRTFTPICIGVAKDINTFSWKYINQLSEEPVEDNGVVSPQSIYHCLAMSYLAAGGETRGQLADAIGFPEGNTPLLEDMRKLNTALNGKLPGKASMVLANGAWLDKTYATFRPGYIEKLREYFRVTPNEIRFADKHEAVKEINSWVSRKTGGRIESIITPEDLQSKSIPSLDIINEPGLVLVNAVYFHGPWHSGFNKKETQPLPFRQSNGRERNVETMHQYGALGYGKYDDYAVLQLPYKNIPFSMYVVLPDQVFSARELVQWAGMHKELRHSIPQPSTCNVDVLLPKFHLDSQYDVKRQLENMGVTEAFDELQADFDEMIIKTPQAYRVYINTIRQKATIDVDEDGSKASAATASVSYSFGCKAAAPIPSGAFHADHPFIFMIVHEPSGTILFNGWVSNP
jgi:serpin B